MELLDVHIRSRNFKLTKKEYFQNLPTQISEPYDYDHSFTSSRSGETNPWWRAQIANGQQAGTGFSGHRELLVRRPFSLGYDAHYTPSTPSGWSYYWEYSGHFNNTVVPHSVPNNLLVQANNRALTEFVSKVSQVQTSFQGGTFLGELPSLVRQLRDPAKSIRKGVDGYLNNLKRGGSRTRGKTRKQRAEQLTDMATNTWLEYSLGWRPLMHDVNDAINSIVDYYAQDHLIQHHVVGFGEFEEDNLYFSDSIPDGRITFDVRHRTKALVKYIGGVGAALEADGIYYAKKLGFGPASWLPTAWELVPYSFVVDYFANVGNIITASTLARSNILFIVKIIRTEREAYINNIKTNLPGPGSLGGTSWNPWADYWYPGASSNKHIDTSRANYNGSLVPSLEFSLPHSSTQWLNLAALAVAGPAIRKLWRL